MPIRTSVIFALFSLLVFSCATKKATQDSYKEPDFVDTTIKNLAPRPTISMPVKFREGETIEIKVEANDIDSEKLTYLYDFDGDLTFEYIGEKNRVKHTWREDGKYVVRVRVQDDGGGIGDASVNIEVTDQKPTAAFKQLTKAVEGSWTKFDAKVSSSPVDPIVKYEWDWNYDGKRFRPGPIFGRQVQNNWKRSGDYTVALRITDADGSKHIASKVVSVADRAPIPRITGPKVLPVGKSAEFDGRDSASVVDPIVEYLWDTNFSGSFQPTSKKSQKKISLQWKAPGSYRIALQVKDSDGSSAIAVHSIRVEQPKEQKKETTKKKPGSKKSEAK